MNDNEESVKEDDPPAASGEITGDYIEKKDESTKEPEVSTHIYADIVANLTEYTERPDLLLDVIEKHDPGFVKKMNQSAYDHSEQTRQGRYTFGVWQAYLALATRVISALVLLTAVIIAVLKGTAGLWLLLGLGVLFAITQGGNSGFSKIIDSLAKLFDRAPKA